MNVRISPNLNTSSKTIVDKKKYNNIVSVIIHVIMVLKSILGGVTSMNYTFLSNIIKQ